MSLALITRCKDEPYLNEFVNHYFHEGVDHIYILKDKRCRNNQFNTVKHDPHITIIKGTKYSNKTQLTDTFRKYKNKHQWIINCDIDEFICTKRNPTRTIKEELQQTFTSVTCIRIPWLMMAYKQQRTNPKCLLETNVFRWNYNKKHSVADRIKDPELAKRANRVKKFRGKKGKTPHKSIFQAKYYKSLKAHKPIDPVDPTIEKTVSALTGEPNNPLITENLIKDAYFVCYHYRIVSYEHMKMKASNTSIGNYARPISELILKNYDFPEIKDLTLKKKSQSRAKLFKPVKLGKPPINKK